MRIGKVLLAAASAVMLAGIGVAHAGSTAPATQGVDSVDKNLNKDPDNRGLQTAQSRIERNRKRQAAHKAAMAARAEKAEHVEKMEHVDRMDRPERPEHPERPGH